MNASDDKSPTAPSGQPAFGPVTDPAEDAGEAGEPTPTHVRPRSVIEWVVTRLIGGALGVAVLLLAILWLMEMGARSAEGSRVAAPGETIVVQGVDMRVSCAGQGRPTVVLEAGAYGGAAQWALVQTELAATTRVCAYDRAGLGWSDPIAGGQDGPARVRQLRAALAQAGEDGPFVMVGHSFGGFFVRAFTDRYGDEVVGAALIDAAHARFDAEAASAGVEGSRWIGVRDWLGAYFGAFGARRWNEEAFLAACCPDLPDAASREVIARYVRDEHRRTASAELRLAYGEQSRWALQLDEGPGVFADRPLAVVSAPTSLERWHRSAEDQATSDALWLSLQEDNARLGLRVRRVVVDGATHASLLGRAEHAERTAAAIRWVVETARSDAAEMAEPPALADAPVSVAVLADPSQDDVVVNAANAVARMINGLDAIGVCSLRGEWRQGADYALGPIPSDLATAPSRLTLAKDGPTSVRVTSGDGEGAQDAPGALWRFDPETFALAATFDVITPGEGLGRPVARPREVLAFDPPDARGNWSMTVTYEGQEPGTPHVVSDVLSTISVRGGAFERAYWVRPAGRSGPRQYLGRLTCASVEPTRR